MQNYRTKHETRLNVNREVYTSMSLFGQAGLFGVYLCLMLVGNDFAKKNYQFRIIRLTSWRRGGGGGGGGGS